MKGAADKRQLIELTVLAFVVVLAATTLLVGCNGESEAEAAFRAATSIDSEATPEEQAAALEEIVRRWPDSNAARKARDELDAIRDQQEAESHGLALMAWDAVREVGRAAEQYKRRYGRFPASFDQLVPDYLDGPVLDPWGHEVVYERTESGYHAISYGEDGLPGGTDLAKDLLVDTSQLKGE